VLTERWGTQGIFTGESFEILGEEHIKDFVKKVNQEDPITYEIMLSIARAIEAASRVLYYRGKFLF
jgi:hypothetical protein